ncbi:MAG: hypothetical protein SV775_06915 [Thermodesulfobacteriota bacterium]|nr:hypothetical protein [Thermodesulfobacteriota bacterium]
MNRLIIEPAQSTEDQIRRAGWTSAYKVIYGIITAVVLIVLIKGYLFIVLSQYVEPESLRHGRLFRVPALYHKHVVMEDDSIYWISQTVPVIDQFLYLLGGLELVKLNRLFVVFVIWAFCSLFSRKYLQRDVSPIVMLVLLTSQVSKYLVFSSVLKPHLFSAGFGLCAMWLHLKVIESGYDNRRVLFGGLILGLSSSVIPQSGILFLFCMLYFGWDLYRLSGDQSNPDASMAKANVQKILLCYALPALLLAAIWPLRSFILKGSFLYPYSEMLSLYSGSESRGICYFLKRLLFLSAPHNIFGDQGIQAFGPFIGLGGVLVLARGITDRKNRFYGYIFWLFVLSLIITYQIPPFRPRYLYLWIVLSAFMCGHHFVVLLELLTKKSTALCLGVAVSVFVGFWALKTQYFGSYYDEDYKKYLRRDRIPAQLSVDAIDFINEVIRRAPDSVWLYPFLPTDYYVNSNNIKKVYWPPITRFGENVLSVKNGAELYELLKEEGIDYLIFNGYWSILYVETLEHMAFAGKRGNAGQEYLRNLSFYRTDDTGDLASYDERYLELIYTSKPNSIWLDKGYWPYVTYVFKLRDRPKISILSH